VLDLYVEDLGDRQTAATAAPPQPAAVQPGSTADQPNLRYVAQLSWAKETGLLSTDSQQAVMAWLQFHRDAVPANAQIWPDDARREALVANVVEVMHRGATVDVDVQPKLAEIPATPGSSGVLVISVWNGGLIS